MKQFCYDKCYSLIKTMYDFCVFFSFRTKPVLEKEGANAVTEKTSCKYCELCDLDDYLMEIDLEHNKLEET